ncbi:MAG: ATP-binding cassette domain-containing protein [Microbacterium sp.]|uniref:ATP-binding cassette domain-containing protein n=1 Tax=Microbacterium sp. TaxID=51671 RepID=UPI0039E68E2F
MDESQPILQMTGIVKTFYVRNRLQRVPVRALDDVDVVLRRGKVLGIIGESGSGKSTLANIIMGLETPDAGTMLFDGAAVDLHAKRSSQRALRAIQVVFQDPYSSLNPRMRVKALLREPLRHERFDRSQDFVQRCVSLLEMVGLPASALEKYPHQFSGGQRQRIAIARALAMNPKVLVCDEAVSALDVSIQAQILALLIDLKERLGLSIVFIAHGLNAVERISDDVVVMNLGKVVEHGPAGVVLQNPATDYTKKLVEISRDIVPFTLVPGEGGVPPRTEVLAAISEAVRVVPASRRTWRRKKW